MITRSRLHHFSALAVGMAILSFSGCSQDASQTAAFPTGEAPAPPTPSVSNKPKANLDPNNPDSSSMPDSTLQPQ